MQIEKIKVKTALKTKNIYTNIKFLGQKIIVFTTDKQPITLTEHQKIKDFFENLRP